MKAKRPQPTIATPDAMPMLRNLMRYVPDRPAFAAHLLRYVAENIQCGTPVGLIGVDDYDNPLRAAAAELLRGLATGRSLGDLVGRGRPRVGKAPLELSRRVRSAARELGSITAAIAEITRADHGFAVDDNSDKAVSRRSAVRRAYERDCQFRRRLGAVVIESPLARKKP